MFANINNVIIAKDSVKSLPHPPIRLDPTTLCPRNAIPKSHHHAPPPHHYAVAAATSVGGTRRSTRRRHASAGYVWQAQARRRRQADGFADAPAVREPVLLDAPDAPLEVV
jgi:hypothetical protein